MTSTVSLSRQPWAGLAALTVLMTGWLIANATLGDFIAPHPTEVFGELIALFRDPDSLENLMSTLTGLALGLSIATAAGVVIGVLTGSSDWMYRALSPVYSVGNSTPMIALIPILILWFGLGLPSIVAGAVLLGIFPIAISTTSAIHDVDPRLIEVGKTFGMRRVRQVVSVIFPGSLPGVLNGIRISIGRVFIGVVAGEMLVGQQGLGWSARNMGTSLNMAGVLAHIVVIACLAVVGFRIFDVAIHRIWPWLPTRS